MRPAIVLLLLFTLARPGLCTPTAWREAKIARLLALLESKRGDPQVLLSLGCEYVHLADETEQAETLALARKYVSMALDADPNGAEPLAWLGVFHCLEAKFGGGGASAKSLALQGLKELDSAVARDPDHLTAVMMRATVCLRVPKEWGRVPRARDDLLKMELTLRRYPDRIKKFDLAMDEVYFRLGQALHASGETTAALVAWKKATQVTPRGRYATEAHRSLRRYGP
ncbi:MAG: hypothetical protein HY815_28405 [Candidatus Riflebacteria bacterium]|nr:hypothetical protein [Candidatus Riflebacteria bacterium]